ncbi:MAG: dihydroorotate dehydrogenase [Oscillospiraceae bacterium]|jgi:dihydroorotate dehydrogenase (NAD+) catalytic subunit
MKLKTSLAGLELDNPVIPASGTFGFGYEFAKFYDLDILGSISLKGTTLEPRFGNPTPRIAECSSGMLNAIGLQNPGVDAVINQELPRLREVFHKPAIANISGFSVEEYVEVAKKFDACDEIGILEINISCPNVKHGGMAFGTDPKAAAQVCAAVKKSVKKPVFMKLTPNVTDIAAIARACEASGADGLTLINTLLGMRIEPRTGRPIVSTGAAGFSGPAVKPVALRMVWEVYKAVGIPIIGAGGIACADDALEFLAAGASAVQVGAQNLVDPFACRNIIAGLSEKLDEYGIDCISNYIGRAHEEA